MANKKRRRRPRTGRAGGGGERAGGAGQRAGAGDRAGGGGQRAGAGRAGAAGGGDETGPPRAPSAGRPNQRDRPRADRQERKQQARRAREAALRAQRRRATIRRFVASVVVAAVVVGVFVFLTRASGPNPFPEVAEEAAEAAGCLDVQTPVDSAPGNQHLNSGQTFEYQQRPATSGQYDPSPLPGDPAVYTEMPAETMLVHNLEHAFVNIYYRQSGPTALAPDIVGQLATLAEGDERNHVLLSPHTSLPDGVDFAVTAWNKLLTCPNSVTADQARTIAQGFMTAFECTGNAPEPNQSEGC